MQKTKLWPALMMSVALALPVPAMAGKVKKAVIGAAVITGGVIAYKVAKKLNVGSLTHNLANHPDNVEPYCLQNAERCRTEVVTEIRKILKDPTTPAEQKPPYERVRDKLIGMGLWEGNITTTITTAPPGQPIPQVHADAGTTMPAGAAQVYGGLSDDEQILEQNLLAAGVQKLPGQVALHLVQVKQASYAQASKILQRFHIDRNDARNGTFVDASMAARLKSSAKLAKFANQTLNTALQNEASENSIAWGLYDLQEYVQKNAQLL